MSTKRSLPDRLLTGEKWKDAELCHLRTLIAVAGFGSFSKAAEHLGLTQPCISQQIQKLESLLDVTLLNRTGRRVSLTPSGRYFYGQAQDILRLMQGVCRTTTHVGGKKGEYLRVGVVPICNATFMPLIIGRFLRQHPDCTITVEEVSASDIEAKVESGHFDFGVGFLPHASPKLRYQPLIREKFVLVVQSNHPLANHSSVLVSVLEDHKLILLPPSYFMRHLIDRIFRQNRIVPRVQVEVNSATAIIRTVLTSGLATLMPPFTIAFAKHPELRGLELQGRQPFVELGIIHHPRQRDLPNISAINSFCEIALQVMKPK